MTLMCAQENVFITSDGIAKLGDFGLARAYSLHDFDPPSKTFSAGHAGSIRFQAPEILVHGAEETTKSDVWAFGMLLYQA